ncbi:MAG: peptidase [Nitrospirae bacterium]|nr:peptidase [Nitrospirota bacterium]
MVFVPALVLLLLFPSVSNTATPQEEFKKIQEQLQAQKKKLTETLLRESSVLNELDNVNIKLSNVEAALRKYRKILKQTESEIETVNRGIAQTRESLEKQKDWLARKLRIMQRYGYAGDMVMVLMSAEDVPHMMRVWKYMENLTRYEHNVLANYRANLRALDEKSGKLLLLKAELEKNTEKVMTKEKEMGEKKREKELILSSVRTEKDARRKMISELKETSQRLLDIIRESSRTDDYAAEGFGRLKGKLFWPAEGKIAIPYGSQKDPQFDTPVFRNGIHIRTDDSADTRSVYTGKVIFAEWFKGFGQLVIINHGSGYHTLYGNLSEIFSRVGDIIKENQIIGKVGTSGILNAPGLYFEIRYKGKPLDPVQWLTRKRR